MHWPLLVVLAATAPAQDPPSETPEAPEATEDAPLPVTQGPEILEYVDAPYPPEAEKAGLEAVVKVQIELDETGATMTCTALTIAVAMSPVMIQTGSIGQDFASLLV